MKKILKSLVISMIIVCSMTASIFATSAEDIKNKLLSIGVPSPYVGAVVEYLQKTTISQAEYNKIVSYINDAKDIIGDVKDISALSDSDKLAIKNLATQAGNTLGLDITFGKVDGVTTLIITDTNGNAIVKMDTLDIIDSVKNFDPSTYVDLVEEMVEYSNNTGNESDENGKPESGKPENGNDENGKPESGKPENGNDENGKPESGKPEDGSAENGKPESGKPEDGSAENGKPESGKPENGNPGNSEFDPVGGELTQTATPYGNMMLVGVGMIIAGAGIALIAKKQFA